MELDQRTAEQMTTLCKRIIEEEIQDNNRGIEAQMSLEILKGLGQDKLVSQYDEILNRGIS